MTTYTLESILKEKDAIIKSLKNQLEVALDFKGAKLGTIYQLSQGYSRLDITLKNYQLSNDTLINSLMHRIESLETALLEETKRNKKFEPGYWQKKEGD
jgi:hypothetical protein